MKRNRIFRIATYINSHFDKVVFCQQSGSFRSERREVADTVIDGETSGEGNT